MADMRTAFAAEATALLDEDPLAAVVLAEISADLFAKAAARHPERVLNVGIREQLMVSVGGGLALAGRAHRLLSLGVPRTELRRYGTPADHAALLGLDAAGIRHAVTEFLGLT